MKNPYLTSWDRYYLRILLLEVCDVPAGIRISDLLRDERVEAYARADLTNFRENIRSMVTLNLLYQRGKTSGKVYRTTLLGLALAPLLHQHQPHYPAFCTLGIPRDLRRP